MFNIQYMTILGANILKNFMTQASNHRMDIFRILGLLYIIKQDASQMQKNEKKSY